MKLPKIGENRKPIPSSNSTTLMQDLTRPETYSMVSLKKVSPLILEALDCIVIEIFDIYSRIRRATSMVLTRIYESAGTAEVTLALKIMRTAESQQDQLCSYFKFCRSMGVLNFKNDPTLKPLSEDIRKLEQMLATGGQAFLALEPPQSRKVADELPDLISFD
ncbi:hypothetical protein ACET3Z_007321 [Daucus carota]